MIDIPKYSAYQNLYCYVREIKHYVTNHALKLREFSDSEVTYVFLSHPDSKYFKLAIGKCETALQMSIQVDAIYLVQAIAGTIDQLHSTPPPRSLTTRSSN